MIADELKKAALPGGNLEGANLNEDSHIKLVKQTHVNIVTDLKNLDLKVKANETADWLDNLKASYSMAEILNHGRGKRSRLYWFSRRVLEFVGASVVTMSALPLFALIGLAIKFDSKGPIFFTQSRVGERLKFFKIYKFRTMYLGSENSPVGVFDEEKNTFRRPTFNEDKRVTRVGKVLRKWSLDELPQMINILIGDMSLVGPRPLMAHEALDIPPDAMARYSVPAGLTGLAQIRDRGIILDQSRFDADLEYVSYPGYIEDMKIVWGTFPKIKQE
jgi:lipopolysaccharide/colanic/teichoic acid biosynthesis glycosyltransferase